MIGKISSRLLACGRGDGLRARLLFGGMGVGVLRVLSLPLTLLGTALLARGLGPKGFGEYAFVISLVTTLSIPLGPALMQLTTRETAAMHLIGEGGRVRALLRWANRSVLSGAIIMIAPLGGYAAWMADWRVDDRWTVLVIGLAALPLLGLNAVRNGVLAGLRHVVMAQLPEVFIRPVALVTLAALLLSADTLSPATAVGAFVGGAAFALLVGAALLRRRLPDQDVAPEPIAREQGRQWMRAWVPFTLLVAVSTLNTEIGIILLGWLSSSEQVAAMRVAQRGAILVALSLGIVDSVISPYITRANQQGDKGRLEALARQSARVVFLAALPIAIPLVFFGYPILFFVLGKEYADIASAPMAILAGGNLINMAFGSIGILLTMSGFEKDATKGLVVALAVNFLFSLVLVPIFGAIGSAVSSASGLFVCNIFLLFKVFLRFGFVPTAFSFKK